MFRHQPALDEKFAVISTAADVFLVRGNVPKIYQSCSVLRPTQLAKKVLALPRAQLLPCINWFWLLLVITHFCTNLFRSKRHMTHDTYLPPATQFLLVFCEVEPLEHTRLSDSSRSRDRLSVRNLTPSTFSQASYVLF